MVLAVYLRLPQKAHHAKFWGCCASQFVSMHCVCRRWPPASIAWYIARGDSAGFPGRIAGSQLDAADGEPLDELFDRMLMGIRAYAAFPRSRTWSSRLLLSAHCSEASPCSPCGCGPGLYVTQRWPRPGFPAAVKGYSASMRLGSKLICCSVAAHINVCAQHEQHERSVPGCHHLNHATI